MRKKDEKKRRLLSEVMALALVISLLAIPTGVKADTTLRNPVITKDSSMKVKQKVTYDTIYFGSYPQAEVVESSKGEYTVDLTIRNGEDFIVDAKLYNKLKKATWKNNETTIDGEKYRRLKSTNATMAENGEDFDYEYWEGSGAKFYHWKDNSYHYFKYQPIKWRVLQVKDDVAFLTTNVALDCKEYNEKNRDITWEKCTLRKYLNDDFFQSAFSKEEGNVIISEYNNGYETAGGKATIDKIFLLSYDQMCYYTTAYGFVRGEKEKDEARQRKSSTYAKAMGCMSNDSHVSRIKEDKCYDGNCEYWLRSPGRNPNYATIVFSDGRGDDDGDVVHSDTYGVCPALKLDLSDYTPIYAGTICTDGTVTNAEGSKILQSQFILHAKVNTYSVKELGIKSVSFSLGAETTGNGKLGYKITKGSSKYIEVNKNGRITLMKGCPNGTYQVTITASKTDIYKRATKKINIQVK